MRQIAAAVTLMAALFVSLSVANAFAAQASVGCGSDSQTLLSGKIGEGSVGVTGSCSVRPSDITGPSGRPILVIDCGYATATDDHTFWNRQCGPTGYVCPPVPGNPYPHQFLTTLALTDPVVAIAQWCAGLAAPVPTAAALRQEVQRLLIAPAIGVSPATGTGLVNLKTLFWISTGTTRNLGPARLIGLPVQLRVNYQRTDFDFGDGAGATLQPGPGTPYDPDHDCGACADSFGHTYTRPGPVTITAHTYWQAQYRIAGQAWTTITGPPLTATNPATARLTIAQAHSRLVNR